MPEWMAETHPFWILLIFPLLFGAAVILAIAEQRRWNAKVRNPHTMTNKEYEQHNRGRFRR